MGFLNGAYGKLMAGRLVRELQYQLTGVQSRLRRVTRELGDAQKSMQAQKRNMDAMMKSQMQTSIYAMMRDAGVSTDMNANMTEEQRSQYFTAYNTAMQKAQMQYSMAQSFWEQSFEMQQEAMLQPLKDEEESLQTEKDNLESRLKIAQAEYDAKKEEEKAGVKSLTPDYTGQA